MAYVYADSLPSNLKITQEFVENTGYNTLDDNGLDGWEITWDNAKNRYGCCYSPRKLITLSLYFWERLDDKREMVDTVLHEVAHALDYVNNGNQYRYKRVWSKKYRCWDKRRVIHGPEWKHWCRVVGARPKRCALPPTETEKPKASDKKYALICKKHGFLHGFSRRPKLNRCCGKCVRENGLTGYQEEYKLRVKKNW